MKFLLGIALGWFVGLSAAYFIMDAVSYRTGHGSRIGFYASSFDKKMTGEHYGTTYEVWRRIVFLGRSGR